MFRSRTDFNTDSTSYIIRKALKTHVLSLLNFDVLYPCKYCSHARVF